MKSSNIIIKLFILFLILNTFQFIECKEKEKSNNSKNKSEEPKVKVSIIIPVYNGEDFIERSLKSALDQTLKEIEVIVIDDKSTDKTLEIVKKYESDKRLKIISLNQNQGVGTARNLGMELAVGEFIGFIDSDDYADKRFYEFLYKYSKDKDMVNGIFVNSTNLSEKYSHHRKFTGYGGTYDSIWSRNFINKYHIRYPTSRNVGEDKSFRKIFLSKNPRKIQTPDEGIYYYYKRREGSLMNFSSDYIKKLSEKTKEGQDNATKETLIKEKNEKEINEPISKENVKDMKDIEKENDIKNTEKKENDVKDIGNENDKKDTEKEEVFEVKEEVSKEKEITKPENRQSSSFVNVFIAVSIMVLVLLVIIILMKLLLFLYKRSKYNRLVNNNRIY